MQVDAVSSFNNTIEFGDFLRAVSTFCFYGKDELLRSMFVFADKNKRGKISHAHFVDLLNVLHPFDKTRWDSSVKPFQCS